MSSRPGQRAWIIGASEGMARELALLLAAQGWRLILSARSTARLESLAEETGGQALTLDASDRVAIYQAAQQLFVEPLDLILMNVGAYEPMPALAFDATLFERLNQTNFLSSVYLLDAILPHLRQQGGGEVIFNVSAAAYCGLPGAAPYSAPKAALLHMVEALTPELAREQIRLRVINPGFVESRLTAKNRFKMPWLMSSSQAAQSIMRQLDSQRFEISFPWQLISLLKLLRCLPWKWRFWLSAKLIP